MLAGVLRAQAFIYYYQYINIDEYKRNGKLCCKVSVLIYINLCST
jgi:hypothetical protein